MKATRLPVRCLTLLSVASLSLGTTCQPPKKPGPVPLNETTVGTDDQGRLQVVMGINEPLPDVVVVPPRLPQPPGMPCPPGSGMLTSQRFIANIRIVLMDEGPSFDLPAGTKRQATYVTAARFEFRLRPVRNDCSPWGATSGIKTIDFTASHTAWIDTSLADNTCVYKSQCRFQNLEVHGFGPLNEPIGLEARKKIHAAIDRAVAKWWKGFLYPNSSASSGGGRCQNWSEGSP